MNQSSANSRQVGGSHYKQPGAIQHWDYAVANGLGYFEGQISKYVTRWPHKHPTLEGKLDDVGKAGHFLDKLIEVAGAGLACPVQTHMAVRPTPTVRAVDYAKMHRMGSREMAIMVGLEQWGQTADPVHLINAKVLVAELVGAAHAMHDQEGAEPGSGYVNQD